MRNYYINTRRVLSGSYPFSRLRLLYTYIKLLIKAFLHHRFYATSNGNFFKENVLGYQVKFFTYAHVINLFEEIFIHEVYNSTVIIQNHALLTAEVTSVCPYYTSSASIHTAR